MSVLRRLLGGPLLALTWIVTSMADLLLHDPAMMHSGAGALQSALTAGLLLWPMTVGSAAAMTVRPLRPELRDLVLAAPAAARMRLVMKPLVMLTAWALAGLAASALACAAVAGIGGSWAAWPAYLGVLPTATGTIASAAVGGALGLLFPYWATPPIAAALTYLGYLMQWDATLAMSAYSSASARGVVILVPDPNAVTRVVTVHLLLAVAAIALGAVRLAPSRRIGALALGATLAAVVVLGLGGAGQAWYRPLPEAFWACTPVADGGHNLCLPREQSRDLAAAAASLTDIDRRVGESFAASGDLRYGPVAYGLGTLPVTVPFGELDTFAAASMQSIAGYVVDCAAQARGSDAAGLDQRGFEEFYAYIGYLQDADVQLVGGDRVPAMSPAEAQSLVGLAAQGCREG